MYLQYLRAFQQLTVASSHIIQAQKRKALRRCLECCMARMLEIRAHLVSCLTSEHTKRSGSLCHFELSNFSGLKDLEKYVGQAQQGDGDHRP